MRIRSLRGTDLTPSDQVAPFSEGSMRTVATSHQSVSPILGRDIDASRTIVRSHRLLDELADLLDSLGRTLLESHVLGALVEVDGRLTGDNIAQPASSHPYPSLSFCLSMVAAALLS